MSKKTARGPSHWIHGGKLTFFSRRLTEWLQAKENGHLQSFAANMAHAYEIRYGGLTSLNDDLAGHITPDMPSDAELAAYAKEKASKLAALPPEEQAAENGKNKKFREVCNRAQYLSRIY